ncbi:glycoside hydrolase family 15 protein [Candidatus Kaiserbacteria bacterium]|nr:glycoside hydrolase family 15 protein [Candidatus Kaiserbacteria bacterium]
MARAATLGNGNILVGLDYRGQVRDFYYPFVGHANHVSGASGNYVHRLGVFVDDKISWLDEESWDVTVGADPETVTGSVVAINTKLGITLKSIDVVHNEENIFLRSFTLTNDKKTKREITLFISQQFRISESRRGDTGFYDPRVGAIIHYKGTDTFLVNAFNGDKQFTEYNIGLFGIEGREGTYHDAVDGVLEKNPVEHGSVDSVIGMSVNLASGGTSDFSYWIVCGANISETHKLNQLVLEETPEALVRTTEKYWKAWISKDARDLSLLSKPLQTLYTRSLTTIRVHTDNRGGIIASSDTDMLHHGRDTYSYVWPRDAAIIAHSLDLNGYSDATKQFFSFMAKRLEPDGYLMHKYRSDGTLGSSWHPWMIDGRPELPIQEDESALVLYMLWQHYALVKDLEFIESLYNDFIEPVANFMSEFMVGETGLPEATYDLWEEKFGTHTYTASAVYGALLAASSFANLLGKEEPARTYSAVAQRIQSSIMSQLYDEETGMFIKCLRAYDDRDVEYDKTVDISSFFGPIYFGVIDIDDERVERAIKVIEARLRVQASSAGYMRYENDNYYTLQDAGSPNPWVITTLWVAQYHIMKAKNIDELKPAYDLLEWTCSHATAGGVLSEQMHPHTREHLSTSPLIWSHAEFVITADAYIKKYQELIV